MQITALSLTGSEAVAVILGILAASPALLASAALAAAEIIALVFGKEVDLPGLAGNRSAYDLCTTGQRLNSASL
jgi:hypothetical protein